MKKISYLVLCGALLGGAMESWGANVTTMIDGKYGGKLELTVNNADSKNNVRGLNGRAVAVAIVRHSGHIGITNLRGQDIADDIGLRDQAFAGVADGYGAAAAARDVALPFTDTQVDYGAGPVVIDSHLAEGTLIEMFGGAFGNAKFMGDFHLEVLNDAFYSYCKKKIADGESIEAYINANAGAGRNALVADMPAICACVDQKYVRDLIKRGMVAYAAVKFQGVEVDENKLTVGLERLKYGPVAGGAIAANDAEIAGWLRTLYDAGGNVRAGSLLENCHGMVEDGLAKENDGRCNGMVFGTENGKSVNGKGKIINNGGSGGRSDIPAGYTKMNIKGRKFVLNAEGRKKVERYTGEARKLDVALMCVKEGLGSEETN